MTPTLAGLAALVAHLPNGLSAKQVRALDVDAANRAADYIASHREALVAEVSGILLPAGGAQ